MNYRTKPEFLKLFKKLGLEYTDNNIIRYKPLLKLDLALSPYYLANLEEFTDLNTRYGDQIKQHYLPPVEIRFIHPSMGYGLFALEDIPQGSFIGEYTGEVKKAQPIPNVEKSDSGYPTDYAWDYPDDIPGHPTLEIDALTCGNIFRFLNHSFSPNVQCDHTMYDNQWRLIFWVCEDIPKGKQLFTNYGEDYWNTGARELITGLE